MESIKKTGNIFWAQSDRDWILDGAMVHVSMVAFDDGDEKYFSLDGKQVEKINPDLTSSVDISRAEKLIENQNYSFMGVTPAGPFDIPMILAKKWMTEVGNPNGRSNADVLHPYYNGLDLTRRPRDIWTIDFTDKSIEKAAQYEKPFEYVKANVYPVRKKNNRAAYREKWWQYAETRPAMRIAFQSLSRYIGTPMVAKD